MKILLALLVFSLIVVFHEFGHFLFARLNHVTVVEFSLGMGPRLFSVKRGETAYSIKVLPFGGSCMMLGEDMADLSEGTFGSKNVWQRISIVLAGPLFNFLLAYLFSMIVIFSIGYDAPMVLKVGEGTAAQETGLKNGDLIRSIDGKKIHLYREVSDYVLFHQDRMASGTPIPITWEHEGERMSGVITPKDDGTGTFKFGITGSSSVRVKASLPEVLYYSGVEVGFWIHEVIGSLKLLVSGGVSMNDLSGPVGVVDMIGDTYEEVKSDGAFYVWLNMINIAILLSANLGVMNLLPIPALDGGRLLIFLVELVRRKRMNPELEGNINLVGFALLMLLMVVILFNDVRKIFL